MTQNRKQPRKNGQFQSYKEDKEERKWGLWGLVFAIMFLLVLLAIFGPSDAKADTIGASSGSSSVGVNTNGANNTGVSNGVNFGDTNVKNKDYPASSAYAPSSFSQAPCQGWTSGGASFVFMGATGGGSKTISWCVPLFMATLPGTTTEDMQSARSLSEQIMCNTDSEYKKARKQQGNECLE